MSWSEQQQQAIDARGQNLLVAAAAGSGKTSVLVERIIRLITRAGETGPVDVDRLLVVTFTNAAAAEMRARIGARLAELKEKTPSRHIERQITLLQSAAISTIHAFCQSVVRQYFYLLDIDPGFRIASGAEIELLKADVLERVFTACYEADDRQFRLLLDHYGDSDGDDTLFSLILELYQFSRSHPWPQHWLRELSARFDIPAHCSLDDTPWSELVRGHIQPSLERVAAAMRRLANEAAAEPGFTRYAEHFAAEAVMLEDIVKSCGKSWRHLELTLSAADFGRIPPVKDVDPELKESFQQRRDTVKSTLKDIRLTYFNRPAELLAADMRSLCPVVDALVAVVLHFARDFAKAKQEKGIVDFNDLEHFCLTILLDPDAAPGEQKPSAVALELREKFREVLIDEYQDTNGVQETILRLVTRQDPPNAFMVGDVKQSIYRFRLAEPRLFMEKYRNYPIAKAGSCRRIDLAQNFRSRPEILYAVNFLFGQLLTEKVAELDYGAAERLEPGLGYPPCEGSVAGVELYIMERNPQGAEESADSGQDIPETSEAEPDAAEQLTGFAREAKWIAGRVKELMTGGYQVYDKDIKGYRPIKWRDIVILLRSTQGKAFQLLDVFRNAGIPAYAEMDSGYFRETEVQVVMSLLQVIDNPRQDIHLAGTLRSPLFGFTAQDLAKIRLGDGAGRYQDSLWDSLERFRQENTREPELCQKAEQFTVSLNRWRGLARRKSVAELLWLIYDETGYYDYAGGMPGGLFRQANLRVLYDRARQFEATNYRGLFRFLRFIESIKSRGSDLSIARALGENEDVVRVMSIHKSKGLEFPVVFVADLGKGFNRDDIRGTILRHRDWGIGPYVTLPGQGFRYPSLARQAIALEIQREARAEEMRVLYVAMTRAREKLILVGSVSKLVKKCFEWSQTLEHDRRSLPDSVVTGAKSYLDWICPAVVRHPDGSPLRELGGAAEAADPLAAAVDASDACCQWLVGIDQNAGFDRQEQSADCSPLWEQVKNLEPVAAGTGEDWAQQAFNWHYPYQAAVGKPAKLTVTEIKRRFAAKDYAGKTEPVPAIHARPGFTRGRRLTPAQIGTIMHSVMQHLNLGGQLDIPDIKAQVGRMVDAEILLPEEARAVNSAAIAAFFNSELGRRMRAAEWLRRELPFSMMLPASRFYPDMAGLADEIFIQGVIDCLFQEEGGLVLVDYKNDYTDTAWQLAEKYSVQLAMYAEAVEAILKQPVKAKYVYAFSKQEAVLVP